MIKFGEQFNESVTRSKISSLRIVGLIFLVVDPFSSLMNSLEAVLYHARVNKINRLFKAEEN